MLAHSHSTPALHIELPLPLPSQSLSPSQATFPPIDPLPSPIMSPASITPLPTSPQQQHAGPSTSFTSPSSKATPSTPKSKNYHPYLIQSTSSSLLTRSNSSPAQPVNCWGHTRSSKSMNSLSQVLSPADSPAANTKSSKKNSLEEENRRRSMDSPSRPAPVRRSGTLPDFLLASGSSSREKTTSKDLHLPLNPKTWTPADLAQYLGQTLRTGGLDGHGQVLPAPLVEDIKSWVLRQRVSGRVFLRGSSDGWEGTRPPPFLPLLQTIARKLRRNSLNSRLDSHAFPTMDSTNPDNSFGHGSILMEEDELLSEDEAENEVTGVRRMAIAFDARSSASEASGDEGDDSAHEVGKLKPQWTGESVGDRWRRWEEKAELVAEEVHYGGMKRSVSDASSVGGLGDAESSPVIEQAKLPQDHASISHSDSEEDDSLLKGGTIKALPVPTTEETPSLPALTPPPPYTSSFPFPDTGDIPADSTAMSSFATHLTPNGTPQRAAGSDGSRYSVTPTPERPKAHTSGLGLRTPDDSPEHTPSKASKTSSPHISNMSALQAGGANPYATLRGSPSGPRHPTGTMRSLALSGLGDEEDEEEDEEASLRPASLGGKAWGETELAGSRWTTARRVTLRPSKVQSLFEEATDSNGDQSLVIESDFAPGKPDGRAGDDEVEQRMKEMMAKIEELEQKLDAATTPQPAAPPALAASPSPEHVSDEVRIEKTVARGDTFKDRSILQLLGLARSPSEDDGLPRRVMELPAYLFLVGVGVGAIMVRVLIGRQR